MSSPPWCSTSISNYSAFSMKTAYLLLTSHIFIPPLAEPIHSFFPQSTLRYILYSPGLPVGTTQPILPRSLSLFIPSLVSLALFSSLYWAICLHQVHRANTLLSPCRSLILISPQSLLLSMIYNAKSISLLWHSRDLPPTPNWCEPAFSPIISHHCPTPSILYCHIPSTARPSYFMLCLFAHCHPHVCAHISPFVKHPIPKYPNYFHPLKYNWNLTSSRCLLWPIEPILISFSSKLTAQVSELSKMCS